MALEHSCHLCGHALGRVCVSIEPVYGLPIVVCPGCNARYVRRRHPLEVTWRSVRHATAAATGLVWRVLGFALLIGVSLGVVATLVEVFNSVGPVELWRMARDGELDEGWWRGLQGGASIGGTFLIGMYLAWWFAVGVTLTTAFAHVRRRWVVWAVFTSVSVGGLAIADLYSHASHMWHQRGAGQSPTLGQIFWDFNRMSGWLAVGMALAVTSVPLGRVLRRGLAGGEAKRWRNRYVRARKRRVHA